MKFVLVVAVMVEAWCATANAETCDPTRTQCCEWWTVDTGDGGAFLENSYAKLQERIASDREISKTLCDYFGPADSSCAPPNLSEPRCIGGSGRAKCTVQEAWGEWETSLQRELDRVGTWTPPWSQLAIGAGDLIGAFTPRNIFANVGTVLSSYGFATRDMLTRVRSARRLLNGSAGPGLKFLSAFGAYGDVDLQLVDLWNVGGQFGGAAELDDQTCRNASIGTQVAAVQRTGRNLARLPAPPTVEIAEPIASAVVSKTSTAGAIVIGSWKPGSSPPARGTYPIAWLTRAGGSSFDVKVTRETGSQGERRIRLTAGPPGDEAVIELVGTPPDSDRDGVADARDRCPRVAGTVATGCPPACPANSTWDGAICRCHAGYDPAGTTCVASTKRQPIPCGSVVPEDRFKYSVCSRMGGRPCATRQELNDAYDAGCRGEVGPLGGRTPFRGNRCLIYPDKDWPSSARTFGEGYAPAQIKTFQTNEMWCVP